MPHVSATALHTDRIRIYFGCVSHFRLISGSSASPAPPVAPARLGLSSLALVVSEVSSGCLSEISQRNQHRCRVNYFCICFSFINIDVVQHEPQTVSGYRTLLATHRTPTPNIRCPPHHVVVVRPHARVEQIVLLPRLGRDLASPAQQLVATLRTHAVPASAEGAALRERFVLNAHRALERRRSVEPLLTTAQHAPPRLALAPPGHALAQAGELQLRRSYRGT